MTQQEALAQALPGTYELEAWAEDMRRADLDHDEVRANLAAAILDALPEGWVLRGPEEHEQLRLLVDAYERKGAQQERERLRQAVEDEFAKWDMHGDEDVDEDGEWCLSKGSILRLLADPEDDR